MFKKLSCLTFAFAIALSSWAENIQSVISYYHPEMSKGFIFISKADMTLTLVNSQGKTVVTYPMACGKVKGQKRTRGDYRTPEGHFVLQNIQDASSWGHDFHDGKGFIKHAYGPWFLRLQTGFAGIGIHGTHAPESIGTRASEGCIRLDNANLAALRQKVTIGMPVIIGPEEGVQMLIANHVPSPEEAGARGLTNVTLASNTRAASTAAQPAKPTTTAKPATTKPVEKDKPAEVLTAATLATATTSTTNVTAAENETPVLQPATAEPVTVAEVATPVGQGSVKVVDGMLDVEPETDLVILQPETSAQPADAAQPALAEDTQAEPAQTAAAEAETVQAEVTEPAETAAQTNADAVEQVGTATQTQPEAAVAATTAEPHYEVVVEEVTGPDGEVKFEVRYVLVP